MTKHNRVMIYGPKDDGSYLVELWTADGESLAISIPRTKAGVIKHFQAWMPYGLVVPDGRECDAPIASTARFDRAGRHSADMR
jgi:hypothetical protein